MGLYTWDLEDIKTNIHDDRKIQALSSEYNNKVDKEILNLFSRSDSFRNFKKMFRRDFITMCRISEDMVDFIFNLHEKVSLRDLSVIELPTTEIDDEILVKNVYEAFEEINDKEILEEIKEIINPDNHFLKITNKTDNEVGDYVGGRVIKGEDKTVYGSFYKHNNNEDIAILAHEIGHMLAHRLFHGKQNELTQIYLTEVESYYIELLVGYLVAKKYDMDKLSMCFRSNRLTKIIDHAWDIYIQYIMNTYLLWVDYKEIDRRLQQENYIHPITKEDYNSYIKIPLLYRSKMINSYMVAIELFRITVEDLEKGINTYKKLFTSDIADYNKLLNKYKINYLKDESTLDCLVDEAKGLKKVLTRQEV